MRPESVDVPARRKPSAAASLGWITLCVLWNALRLPVFILLRLAEPFVRLTLAALGMLSILGALFYQFASSLPHPPVFPLLAFAVGCGLTLLLYERILRLLS
jgi:hypothetical protein